MFIDRVRPPEWLHERRCLARAIISAVENVRDSVASDLAFRLWVQGDGPITEADEYLLTGISTCICQAPWPDQCPDCGGFNQQEDGSFACPPNCPASGEYNSEVSLTEEVQRQPQCWRQVVDRLNSDMHGEHEFLVP